MSDKLWNKAKSKKEHDWQSLKKEYENIIGSLEDEDRLRKNVIISIFLAFKKEDIWELIEKEYRYLCMKHTGKEAFAERQELEKLAKKHDRECVNYGPQAWIVCYGEEV